MSMPMPYGFEKPYAAFLFDMDGTILNSIRAAERVWSDWARRHGLDVAAFLPKMHGSRGIDTITRLNLPGVDPEHESKLVTEAEIADVSDVVAIPGAATFLSS
ncbi:HAD family hydrolase, partial [Rhizobium ruizarguesonis]